MDDMFDTYIVAQTASDNDAITIFLHGAGGTGSGVAEWAACTMQGFGTQDECKFAFPNVKLLYPTAPKRVYTADRGRLHHVWFDWPTIDPSIPEDIESIDAMCQQLSVYIEQIIKQGTPAQRIVVGGLSMGGVMALHLVYRFHKDVAAVFGLSTFLNDDSVVYKSIQESSGTLPPLFQTHGARDTLIRPEWGQQTFDRLHNTLGVKGEFHMYEDLAHSMCRPELNRLQAWIQHHLPPLTPVNTQ